MFRGRVRLLALAAVLAALLEYGVWELIVALQRGDEWPAARVVAGGNLMAFIPALAVPYWAVTRAHLSLVAVAFAVWIGWFVSGPWLAGTEGGEPLPPYWRVLVLAIVGAPHVVLLGALSLLGSRWRRSRRASAGRACRTAPGSLKSVGSSNRSRC